MERQKGDDDGVTPGDNKDFDTASEAGTGETPTSDNLFRLQRKRRLLMNRDSARARRQRQKETLANMEEKVDNLSLANKRLGVANEQLVALVAQLRSELAMTKSIIAAQNQQLVSQGQQIPPAIQAQLQLLNSGGETGSVSALGNSLSGSLGLPSLPSSKANISIDRLPEVLDAQGRQALGQQEQGQHNQQQGNNNISILRTPLGFQSLTREMQRGFSDPTMDTAIRGAPTHAHAGYAELLGGSSDIATARIALLRQQQGQSNATFDSAVQRNALSSKFANTALDESSDRSNEFSSPKRRQFQLANATAGGRTTQDLVNDALKIAATKATGGTGGSNLVSVRISVHCYIVITFAKD